MKLHKLLPAVLGAVTLCAVLPLLPGESQAAEITSVETIKAGATRVGVSYINGTAGEQYEIYVNGERVNYGTLSETTGSTTTTVHFNLSYNESKAVAAGDIVQVRMQDSDGVMQTVTSTVVPDADPVAPTSMTASATRVTASDSASVSLTFDSGYVADDSDRILVIRYDEDDQALGSYAVDLPDYYDDPVTISLTNSATTDHYILTFVSGANLPVNLASIRIDVVAGNTSGDDTITEDQQALINSATGMSFAYPSSSVSLGESVTPTIQLITEDGTAHTYTGPVIFSYSGDAISAGTFDASGRFTVASDQRYIGSKIQVTAMVGSFSRTVELTVQAGDKSLILSPATGSAGNARALTFQLADGTGNRLRLVWEPTIAEVVINPTDESSEARMSGTVTNLSSLTTNGSGTLLVSSDLPAEADLYIIFRDSSGRFYQTALGHFTFTEATGEDPVSMTLYINSNNYILNGISYTADTQPVIANSRAFMPFRLLVESMGGQVDYDQSTQRITAVYGGTVVVMQIGSTNYTVNGNTQSMDVAPFVDSNSRTLVPVRFMAEAFGFTTTPQYGANGATVSVIVEN